MIKYDSVGGVLSSATLAALESPTGLLIWWCDIITDETVPKRYTWKTHYKAGWTDTFYFGGTPIYGDTATTQTAHVAKLPQFKRDHKGLNQTSIDVAVAASGQAQSPHIDDLLESHITGGGLSGGEMAWGVVPILATVANSQKIVLGTGRCHVRKLTDTLISLGCKSSERVKGQIPGWASTLETWVAIEDTKDNPDSSNAFEQSNTVLGQPNGRYRKGQYQTGTSLVDTVAWRDTPSGRVYGSGENIILGGGPR